MLERYQVSEIAFALHKLDSLVLRVTESDLYLGHTNASSRQSCCAFSRPDHEEKKIVFSSTPTRLDPVTPQVCVLVCLNWTPINGWIIPPKGQATRVRSRTSLALANVVKSCLRAEAPLGYETSARSIADNLPNYSGKVKSVASRCVHGASSYVLSSHGP